MDEELMRITELGQYKLELQKIANSPILSAEAKQAIRFAVYRMDDIIWLKKEVKELQEKCTNIMKVRNNNESV